jgi:hypothetical protein
MALSHPETDNSFQAALTGEAAATSNAFAASRNENENTENNNNANLHENAEQETNRSIATEASWMHRSTSKKEPTALDVLVDVAMNVHKRPAGTAEKEPARKRVCLRRAGRDSTAEVLVRGDGATTTTTTTATASSYARGTTRSLLDNSGRGTSTSTSTSTSTTTSTQGLTALAASDVDDTVEMESEETQDDETELVGVERPSPAYYAKKWKGWFDLFVAYTQVPGHSHTNAPFHEVFQERNLGLWVTRQRYLYWRTQHGLPKPFLSQERIHKLHVIGFKWGKPQALTWESWYGLLLAFKNENGHISVPRAHTTLGGHKLGRWLANQRRRLKQLPRTETIQTRIDLMNAIGFTF